MNFYGFFIALGILVGTLVADYFRKKLPITNHQSPITSLFDLLPWVVIPAVIGARLYHVIDYFDYYIQSPIKILAVWEGGLGIYGGIIGGCFGLFIFSSFISWKQLKRKEIKPCLPAGRKLRNFKFKEFIPQYLNILISNFLSYADIAAIGLPAGQAIGRLGNYFNQELYGLPTTLSWGIYIRPENRLAGFENYTHFHPLFIYESLGSIIIFLLIIKISKLSLKNKRFLKSGSLFLLYLFLYSFLRFFLESQRIESWTVTLIKHSFRVNQLVSIGLMIVSLGLLLLYKRQKDS